MKRNNPKSVVLLTIVMLLICSTVSAQRPFFNKSKDILIAQFDSKPDPDDIHAQAALGSMLAHSDLSGVKYYAVAGAIGKQGGKFIDSDKLFDMAFGKDHWTDANANWNGSVTNIKNKVIPILNNGGKVWVQEAGQSDITADWVAQVIRSVGASKVKNNVIVVQHSEWNQDQTTTSDLNYVKSKTKYFYIDDGNADFNQSWGDHGPYQTPSYRSGDKKWIAQAKSSPNAKAKELWREADRVVDRAFPNGVPYDWSSLKTDGVDFSDCVENWWIFNIDNKASSVSKFWSRYVTNTASSPNPDPDTNPGSDKIVSVSAPNSAVSGNTATVSVEYTASTNRDIIVSFQKDTSPYTTYGIKRVNVSAGSRTLTIEVPIGSNTPIANNAYQFQTYITKTGKGWGDRLDNLAKRDIDCVSGNSNSGSITIRAKGTCGKETMKLKVNGNFVKTWNNVSTSYRDYTHDNYAGGKIEVHFTNDGTTNGCNRNLTVDYMKVCNSTYQTENKATRTGCGNAQTLWCNGRFNFGNLGCNNRSVNSSKAKEDIISFSFNNPVEDILQIYSNEVYNLSLYDANGRQVMDDKNLSGNQTIDVGFLNEGMYFIKYKNQNRTQIKKIIIKK